MLDKEEVFPKTNYITFIQDSSEVVVNDWVIKFSPVEAPLYRVEIQIKPVFIRSEDTGELIKEIE